MGNMESGFGWHYPPGTPGPESRAVEITCPNCETVQHATIYSELGATELIPDECPGCGIEWGQYDDLLAGATEPERDVDQDREAEWERAMDEDDAREEASYHYPPDFPDEP